MIKQIMAFVFVALVLSACAPAVTLEPPAATTAPTETPAPTKTPALLSGGLGLSRQEWEATHTKTGDDILGTIYDGVYVVMFADDRVKYIERQWSAAATIEQAEAEGASFLPGDSALIETYSPADRPETTVNVYKSAWLSDRFDEAQWFGAEPGTLTLQYNSSASAVTRLIVATGNNP